MKPTSKKEHEDQIKVQAIHNFAGHDTLVEVGPGHWRISDSKLGSVFWAELVVLRNCAIAVWGDIEAIVFAYYSGAKGSTNPRCVVNWMSGWSLDYQRQKASIGMGGIGADTESPEVALWQIQDCIDDILKDADEEEKPEDLCRELKEAKHMLKRGDSTEEVRNYLYEEGLDVEMISDIGTVVDPRVIYGIAAINRLSEMLEARDKEVEETEAEKP